MNTFKLNNQIVGMRAAVRMARLHVIRKLCREKEKLSNFKGEKLKEKKIRKANRLREEILSMKSIRADDVSKFALLNTKRLEDILADASLPAETRAKARLATHKAVVDDVEYFRSVFPDWEMKLAPMLAQLGLRTREKKQKEYLPPTEKTRQRGGFGEDDSEEEIYKSSYPSYEEPVMDVNVTYNNSDIGSDDEKSYKPSYPSYEEIAMDVNVTFNNSEDDSTNTDDISRKWENGIQRFRRINDISEDQRYKSIYPSYKEPVVDVNVTYNNSDVGSDDDTLESIVNNSLGSSNIQDISQKREKGIQTFRKINNISEVRKFSDLFNSEYSVPNVTNAMERKVSSDLFFMEGDKVVGDSEVEKLPGKNIHERLSELTGSNVKSQKQKWQHSNSRVGVQQLPSTDSAPNVTNASDESVYEEDTDPNNVSSDPFFMCGDDVGDSTVKKLPGNHISKGLSEVAVRNVKFQKREWQHSNSRAGFQNLPERAYSSTTARNAKTFARNTNQTFRGRRDFTKSFNPRSMSNVPTMNRKEKRFFERTSKEAEVEKEVLHPSWEAKRKMREQQNVQFQGKKIKFDD